MIKTRTILLHLFGCLCFIVLPFIFFPRPQGVLIPLNNPFTIRDFIGQFLLIGFFYLTYYWLIPTLYQPKKYVAFSAVIVACFAVIILLPSLATGRFNKSRNTDWYGREYHPPFEQKSYDSSTKKHVEYGPPPFREHTNGIEFFKEINHYLFLFLAVLLFAMSVSINNRWRQTQQEKVDAELAYLKAQVNPHFLFNTLNSIYSLTLQKSEVASDAVVKLAGMMRYVLHEADKRWVSLEKEVEYIEDYIELQRLRFGNQIPIQFTVTGQSDNKLIAPLILIGFIENAFKHGVNAEENSDIIVTINIKEKELSLFVRNNKVHTQENEPSGIGMQNVKNRLKHLYPSHTLTIEDEKTFYSVQLIIPFL